MVNNKHKKGYFIVLIFIIMLTTFMDIPFLLKEYVQNKYPMTKISNQEFLKENENLKDFENDNGVLNSLSSYPWILYNSPEVDFDKVTQIKLDVKYLSEDTAPSEVYVRDLDRCIKFQIKEGENIINIPKNINDGNPIKGFRFNLVNKDDTKIEIEDIVFNDTQSIIKNIFIKQYKEDIAKGMLLLVLCITPILLFKLGLKKSKLNKFGFATFVGSLIGLGVLHKFNAINNIIYFIFISICAFLSGILIYYLLTKAFLYLYQKINKIIKINVQSLLTIIFMLCCFTIYLDIKILFIYLAFYPFYLFGFTYDKFKITESKNNLVIKIILMLSIIVLLKFIFNINDMSMLWNNFDTSNIKLSIIVMILISWFIGFSILSIKKIRKKIEIINILKIKNIYLFFVTYIFSITLYTEIHGLMYVATFILILLILRIETNLIDFKVKNNNIKEVQALIEIRLDEKIKVFFINLCVIAFILLFFEAFVEYYLNKGSIHIFILNYIFTPKCLYNFILLSIIYYLIIFVFGNKLGKSLLSFIGIIILVGNFIKIRYQNSLLKPNDFLQIKELFNIAKNFLNIYIVILLSALVILILGVCIIKFKYNIISIFKPSPNIFMAILMGISLLFFTTCLNQEKFKDVEITKEIDWLGDKVKVDKEGFFIYNYFNIEAINEVKISKPKNYNEQTMNQLKNEIDSLNPNKNISNVNPNVILIMEESMFDIQKINDLKFSKTIDSNIKKYQKGTVISPRFGGGTASVEFEALTGFSNMFFPDDVIQYVTYWNGDDNIPSIAREFNNNGYTTTAIHPNDPDFYNRNQIYQAMGFNKFLSIDDFTGHTERSSRGFVLDSEVNSVIENQLNSTDNPQFIFAVTIENHGLYNSKDSNNNIKISSNKLSDSQIYEAESYAGGLSDANDFIGRTMEDAKNSSRPTIVYVWGDHLPALSAFNNLGYLDNVYNLFGTPLVAYSNYKDINIGNDYITPNQLAHQVLKDAGISYSSYFDYIYDLRKKYPIVHKSFNIDANDEMIKKYQLMQYDMLFGKQYILK
ncbi:hypothetical protein UT300005_15410 [Clostridium sp. CTA-5]